MIGQNDRKALLRRDTRVLYRIKGRGEFLMTNDTGEEPELLRIFRADENGRVSSEGYLLGSLFAHDPYIIPELVKMNCTFGELCPRYWDRDPIVDGLLGLAAGDAFGVPVEFMSRAEVRKIDLQDMVGNDTRPGFYARWTDLIPRGAWSDDTSMTIAAMASIINKGGKIEWDDIMKQFDAWWNRSKYTSLDFPFGLGSNISASMTRYLNGVPALECGGKGFRDNGNGALMRMFPFSMYCSLHGLSEEETLSLIRKAAGITHGHEINAMSCYIYTLFLDECIRLKNPESAYRNTVCLQESLYRHIFDEEAFRAHEMLFELDERSFDPDSIRETGYVVDSLVIAIYSILNTDNYEDAVKMAVNFGYDTDTNGAITGSIAGAMYGKEQIPDRWLDVLRKKDYLVQIGEAYKAAVCGR